MQNLKKKFIINSGYPKIKNGGIQDGVESPIFDSIIDWNATYWTIFPLFFMQFGVELSKKNRTHLGGA
jgi:hypothetical protein